MKTAFHDMLQVDPFLPAHESVLPALLALRKTDEIVRESRVYLESQRSGLDLAKKQLEVETTNLKDQQLLSEALEQRIQSLLHDLQSAAEISPDEIARERLVKLQEEKKKYDVETAKLMKSFDAFIGKHLGPMLAAEGLGGPVVGDMMEIDTDDLAIGFNAQGRLRTTSKVPDQDKRQRRIDDIWGNSTAVASRHEKDLDESVAAGDEIRQLTERLLNNLMESHGDGTAAYVHVEKDSPAARFLVRSRVATFHPKDATRLRLVDFGREIDD